MKCKVSVLAAVLRICIAFATNIQNCNAEWRIEIDSIAVGPGATSASIGFKAYWDIELSSLTLPCVVRSLDAGAFWAHPLPYDTGGNGYYHPHKGGVTWSWAVPWASISEVVIPGSEMTLTGPSITKCDPLPPDTIWDAISPDVFAINCNTSSMAAEATPAGRVFLTLTFNITDVGGTFEVDTTCFTASLPTLMMLDDSFPPLDHGHSNAGTHEATFRKGYVRILKDTDEDGIYDDEDTCPFVYNPLQSDTDNDSDGVYNDCDNCPSTYNPQQEDWNGDGIGDACDDMDDDGITYEYDNCPFFYNPDQSDSDFDGVGDSCDICPGFHDLANSDNDTIPDGCDNCPLSDNPSQQDSDDDGKGDTCDNCPLCANWSQLNTDGDYYGNVCDNCPNVMNDGQEDEDADGVGDACDLCPSVANPSQADTDDDGRGDECDNCPTIPNFSQTDRDRDGIGDACDGCVCANVHCDMDGSPGFAPIDVAIIVQFVFRQLDARPGLLKCPGINGDWNCDGSVAPLDVAWYVQFVYHSSGVWPCDPCECSPYPGNCPAFP